MDHLAILSKKRKILDKILSGNKKIESRWYVFKRQPIGCIKEGDVVYFKESGEPVSAKATAQKILVFENINEGKIKEIITDYGALIGIGMPYLEEVRDKKFCVLVFLNDVKKIEPFKINKKGYGMMNAWISVDDINKLKI